MPAAVRRGFDATMNGPEGYRYLLTSAHFCCEDSVTSYNDYSSHVTRLRRLAQPSVKRWEDAWKMLRDGYMQGSPTKDPCGQCGGTGHILQEPTWVDGFWVNERGDPLEAHENVPKEALMGMEGAVQEILHLDGIYWWKPPKPPTKMKSRYQDLMGSEEE